MAKAFRRKGDRFVARLDPVEREVVLGLMEQTREFIAPVVAEPTGDAFTDLVATMGMPRLDDGDDTGEPVDPALGRLLPSGHREDAEVAAEFRRMTEHGLRERKTLNLTTAIDALTAAEGDKVTLDAEQAQATVVALTDVRLLLGERLDLRTDEDADALEERLNQADDTDPFLHLAAYYDFLTWLQESLAQALMD